MRNERESGREDEDRFVAMDYGYLKLGGTESNDDEDDECLREQE